MIVFLLSINHQQIVIGFRSFQILLLCSGNSF
ncbi:hypothetical protein [Bacillus inaquosorum]